MSDQEFLLRLASPAELREMVQTLTRERDEAAERLRHIQEQLDQMAATTIREMEGWTADALRTAIAFERVTSAELRAHNHQLKANLHEARSELKQVKRERDLATEQLLMVGSEIAADPKLDPMDHRDPRWTPTLEKAAKLRAANARLRRALEPFARFGAAVLLINDESGKWHSIRVDGHEYTISYEDFRRARAALAKAGEDIATNP